MKKEYLILGIAIIAIILAITSNFGNNTVVYEKGSTFDKILHEDKMEVCYISWPPSIIKDPNTGEISGFMIDIINEISKDSDIKIEYIESTWGGFPADLKTGRCDAVIAGIYPTIKRSTSISFTEPFFFAGNGGVIKKGDTRFKDENDLNKKNIKIAVIQGEFGQIYAKKNFPNAQLIVLEQSSDNTAPLVAVTSEQADVGLIMSDVTSEYVKIHPEVDLLFDGKPYTTTPISWAVRKKDQQLLNFLNNGITYLKATGFLDASTKKYSPEGWFTLKYKYENLE